MNLTPQLYNIALYTMVGCYFILSINVPTTKMKIVGILLTVVNYLLFAK